jgi:hypothetical protein
MALLSAAALIICGLAPITVTIFILFLFWNCEYNTAHVE